LTAGASGPDASSPVVTYQPYGLGRVVTIEGGGMWRWAFLPPEQKEYEEVYRDLWHSLMRWLASNAALLPGQTLALRTDKVTFGTEEPATATLLVRDAGGTAKSQSVRLTGESLAQPVVASAVRAGDDPGLFRIVFGKLPEGRYQAAVVGSDDPSAAAAFDIRSRSDERLDLKARPELMARVAKESGGAELTESSPEAVVGQLREHLERDRPAQVRRLSAWDRWWVLLGVCGVWASAWAVRRSGGLV